MDRPLADEAERRGPRGFAAVALRIVEVRERAVDGVEAVGPRRDDDARAGEVPEVARVAGGERQAHPLAGREIAEAEDQRLEPRRAGGDLLDARERRRLLDQRLEPDRLPEAELRLELREQRVEEPHVARRLDLGEDEEVQVRAGSFHHGDDVVVRPARVGAVDPHGAELPAPRELPQGAHGVAAGGLLLGGRHRVLEVEEDEVGVACRGLLDHLRARGRRGELGSSQPHIHRSSLLRPADPRRGAPVGTASIPASASTSAVCSPRQGGRR